MPSPITPEPQHPYPSHYGRGVHWAVDEAWDILDPLPVGMLPNDERFVVAGRIAGALMRVARDGAPKVQPRGDPQPLDRTAVTRLAQQLMATIKVHYLRRPTSRSTALEVLNAVAIALAPVLLAARECGGEGEARAFFELALVQQLDEGTTPTTVGGLPNGRERPDGKTH